MKATRGDSETPWFLNFELDSEKENDFNPNPLTEKSHTNGSAVTRKATVRPGCDGKLINIVLLGLGFCFSFGSLQICMLAQVLDFLIFQLDNFSVFYPRESFMDGRLSMGFALDCDSQQRARRTVHGDQHFRIFLPGDQF